MLALLKTFVQLEQKNCPGWISGLSRTDSTSARGVWQDGQGALRPANDFKFKATIVGRPLNCAVPRYFVFRKCMVTFSREILLLKKRIDLTRGCGIHAPCRYFGKLRLFFAIGDLGQHVRMAELRCAPAGEYLPAQLPLRPGDEIRLVQQPVLVPRQQALPIRLALQRKRIPPGRGATHINVEFGLFAVNHQRMRHGGSLLQNAYFGWGKERKVPQLLGRRISCREMWPKHFLEIGDGFKGGQHLRAVSVHQHHFVTRVRHVR